MNRYPLTLLTILFLFSPVQSQSQASVLTNEPGEPSPQTNRVSWNVTSAPQAVRSGEWLTAVFSFSVAGDWHMYSLDSPAGKPLKVDFNKVPKGFQIEQPLYQTPPVKEYDPNFQKHALFFSDSAQVRAGIQIAKVA